MFLAAAMPQQTNHTLGELQDAYALRARQMSSRATALRGTPRTAHPGPRPRLLRMSPRSPPPDREELPFPTAPYPWELRSATERRNYMPPPAMLQVQRRNRRADDRGAESQPAEPNIADALSAPIGNGIFRWAAMARANKKESPAEQAKRQEAAAAAEKIAVIRAQARRKAAAEAREAEIADAAKAAAKAAEEAPPHGVQRLHEIKQEVRASKAGTRPDASLHRWHAPPPA